MLFNSVDFAIFFIIVFILYWYVFNRTLKSRNVFLLITSYVFYGWWDWRFLFLIAFSSLIDFNVAKRMARTSSDGQRKQLLWLSLAVNLGLLGFFKYYNFFAASFADAFTLLGRPIDAFTLNIILPVGISFYTFQTLSYTIDVYREKIKATDDVIKFFTFVSFFPQLVAGPIERAKDLLPQFYVKKEFHYEQAVDGLRQILIGLFKKIVIADNCAPLVNSIFENYTDHGGGMLLVGAMLFAFQIYGDFSGYSDIAIGVARTLGFRLSQNFAYPYFSRDIAEFWRRWHISLTSWFKDYLYIPLGGSRGGTAMKVRNTFIIFLVSGFWHGANWTFIAWGFLNALLFLPLLLTNRNRSNLDVEQSSSFSSTLRMIIAILGNFIVVSFMWIFFRAESLGVALEYIWRIFTTPFFASNLVDAAKAIEWVFLPTIILLLILEWWGREDEHALQRFGFGQPRIIRWGLYAVLTLTLLIFSSNEQEFIYFQF